jgi:hypothetical protein
VPERLSDKVVGGILSVIPLTMQTESMIGDLKERLTYLDRGWLQLQASKSEGLMSRYRELFRTISSAESHDKYIE